MALYNPKDEDKRRGGWGRKKGSVGWGGAAGTEYWIDPKSQIAVSCVVDVIRCVINWDDLVSDSRCFYLLPYW